MKNFLKRLSAHLDKKSKLLKENTVDLKDYVNDHVFNKIKVESYPYKHVVIDNFFKDDFLQQLNDYFKTIKERGFSADPKDTFEKFSPFAPLMGTMNTDGYVFTPFSQQDYEKPINLFFSTTWNHFFSKLFDKPTTLGTSFALQHHPAGDKTCWIHTDYFSYFAKKNNSMLPNGVYTLDANTKDLTDSREKRGIAIIYYFNNPEWEEGMGGETGIYTSLEEDTLYKKIPPINNRILVFEVSPSSFHAFQGNLKERNSFVQWFHTDLDWCKKNYGTL